MADPPVPTTPELLARYRAMWQSFLSSNDLDIQSRLVLAMEDIRAAGGLTEEDWEAFTQTLPGYEEWWFRVRKEYLDQLNQSWERTKDEP